MTTATQTHDQAAQSSGLAPIMLAALAGITLVFFANFAGASVLHDAAHDARHALAVPCH